MNDLIAIIEVLNAKQREGFVKYIQRLNRRSDTKNIALFKLICQGNVQNADHKLYGKASKNALYVLCNRLQHRLIDFIAQAGFEGETSQEMECLKLLLASRIFFEQKKHLIGFKSLRKAIVLANEIEAYPILNEIYHTYVQYAHLQNKVPLNDLLALSEANNKLYNQELRVNMLYANLRHQFGQERSVKFQDIINGALKDFKLELDATLSFKSIYQLMRLTNEAARESQNYYEGLSFMRTLYGLLESKKDLKGRHAYYRLQASYLMAMVLFRTKFLAESLQLVRQLNELLNKNPRYKNLLKNQLILLESLLQNFSGNHYSAIMLLEDRSKNDLQLGLTLAMFKFQQQEFDKAYTLFKTWNHSDTWYEKKLGWQWVIQKNIMEILLLIERDRLDLVLSRMSSFNRRFNPLLKEKNQTRVIHFMRIVDRLYRDWQLAENPNFISEVTQKLALKSAAEEDIFEMSFYAWLKSKLTGKALYETTLELVNYKGD